MMDKLIARFPEQLKEALEIGSKANISKHDKEIQNIYVAGLGGSGIGANFAKEFTASELKIPFTVGKAYGIPASVGPNTLAIASSYSGNTEETLSAFNLIQDTGAKIVVISSGGKLIELAKENGYDYIQVPGNWPSPRACLGYSVVQQLFILNKLGLISDASIKGVESSIGLIVNESEGIKKEAKEVAERLNNKIPIIYTTDRMSAVAIRQRQQINENAKMLCWHHIVPEMNHNELVGWRKKSDQWAVLYLRNEDDERRNAARIDINKEIISKYADTIIEVYSKGDSLVERMIYLVHLGDWLSFYLSELTGADSIEIDVIDFLKSSLAKL
jgi:glucose/mannose-6-phosphate isomerase